MTTRENPWEIRFATVVIDDPGHVLEVIRTIARRHNARIICFNADKMTGTRHADSAMRHALRAFRSGRMISNSLEMEALLYVSGSRQTSIASAFGIHGGDNRLFVCCCPSSKEAWDALGEIFGFGTFPADWQTDTWRQEWLIQLFGITKAELEAAGPGRLADLVLERVALLEVNK